MAELVMLDVGRDPPDDLWAQLELAVLLVLGIVLDEEPAAVRMKPRRELHDDPTDRQYAGGEVEVVRSQFGQFAPAKAALDIRLHEQLHSVHGRAKYSSSNCSGEMIRRGFFGTGGVFTPLHGCRKVT